MATTTHDAMYQTIGGDAGLTKLFLTFALGGGVDAYHGESLSSAHADLRISDEAFTKIAWHLSVTMDELDVDRPLTMIINGFVEGARRQVVR